jgi:hypothetical protein
MKHFAQLQIVDAKAIDLETHEEIQLIDKPNRGKPSKCLFIPKEVPLGNFRIRLRFDWSDLDEKSDPTLDAEITQNGKPYKEKMDLWHHTYRELQNGVWAYHFKFEKLEFRFKLALTRDKQITSKALIIAP